MLVALLIVGALGLAACQPQEILVEVTRLVDSQEIPEVREVTRVVPATVVQEATQTITETVIIEVTKSPLGTDARPVQLLFAPTVDTAVIASRGNELAQALTEETGYKFVVGVLDDEQTVIDLMCSAPIETIGFLSAPAFWLAKEECNVQTGSVAINSDGYPYQTGMIVTRRDSGIADLQDLDGKSWAVSVDDGLAGRVYFQALFADEGIQPGDIVEVSGESAAMLAVFAGDADFATAAFVPPVMPYEERLWVYGEDDPEPGRYLGIPPQRSPIGYVTVNGEPEFGGYRLRDARSRIFDVEPQIFDRTQIVTLSAPIANETVAYGRDFPLGLARQVTAFLTDFAASEACATSICATDFMGWSGLLPVDEAQFEPIGFVKDTLNLSASEMLELAN